MTLDCICFVKTLEGETFIFDRGCSVRLANWVLDPTPAGRIRMCVGGPFSAAVFGRILKGRQHAAGEGEGGAAPLNDARVAGTPIRDRAACREQIGVRS